METDTMDNNAMHFMIFTKGYEDCINSLISDYNLIIERGFGAQRRKMISKLCLKYRVSARINHIEHVIGEGRKLRRKAMLKLDDPCNVEVISLKLEGVMEKILFILKTVSNPESNALIELVWYNFINKDC